MTFIKKNTKNKSAGVSLKPLIYIAGLIGLILTIYIAYRASISESKLFPISLIALFAGLLFESFRVSDNWKTVVGIFVGTYLFSLISFLPGKHEFNYNFEKHIEVWPYFFIFIFAIFFGLVYKDKVIAKLTEGITLILSISLIYWATDYGFINYFNWFSVLVLTIGIIFTIYTIINALTLIHLSRTNRLTLSIWSSIILFAFAIDNIINVFSLPDIESSKYLPNIIFVGVQYFLLGVSAVYIFQNFIMLFSFIPSKNGNYKNELKEIKKDHIERYSEKQINVKHSIFCILFTGTTYWLNYEYQILPRHTIIWLVVLTFPIVLKLVSIPSSVRSLK